MTIQNDFLPFANSGGANVLTQAAYAGNTTLLANGVQTGVASSAQANKTWRQCSIIASVIAQYINSKSAQNTIDDGTTATLLTNLAQSISLNNYVADTSGTANVLTATISPAPALVDGFTILIKPANSNNSSATFNLNGLGAYAIQNASGALVGGELIAGKMYQLVYIASANIWFNLGAATTATTQPSTDNSTKIATTAFVKSIGYAPLATPAFTGNPTAPTPGAGDNTTHIATTAFVNTALYGSSGLIPSGTRMVFAQASAPTGWTQDTTDAANNRMLRFVSGTGGGLGGSADPTINNVVPSHTHSFTTGTESATHYHQFAGAYANSMGSGNAWPGADTNATGTTGTEIGTHTHSGSTDNGSSQTNWLPRYNSVIICSKN